MNLYISKKNLSSFIDQVKAKKTDVKDGIDVEKYKYVNCLLKFNIYFDFENQKSDGGYGDDNEDDFNDNNTNVDNAENSKIRSWVNKNINQGRDSDGKHDHYRNDSAQYPNEYSIEAIKDNKEYLSSVYLVENPEEGLENIVLCGKPGEETKVLDRLFCGNSKDFYQFHFLPNFSWDDLGNVPPCTDIVICDRFLFCYDGNKKTKDTVRNSIDLMLDSIIPQNSGTVNIVIFIDQTQIEDDLKTQGGTGPDEAEKRIDEAEKRIKDAIETIRKHLYEKGLLPNITVIGNDSSCFPYKKRGPHDRLIITNYSLQISGDSFTYFDTSNKPITEGFYMISGSLVDNNIQNHTEKMLDQLNRLYTEPCPCCNIYGDRKSNLIKFDNMTTLPIKGEKLEGKIVSDEQGYKVRCDKFECSFWTGTYVDTVKVNDDVEFTVKYKVVKKDGRKHLNATKIRLKK